MSSHGVLYHLRLMCAPQIRNHFNVLYKSLRGATSVGPFNPFHPTSEWGLERCMDLWVWSSTVRRETSNVQCSPQRHALLINSLIVSVCEVNQRLP